MVFFRCIYSINNVYCKHLFVIIFQNSLIYPTFGANYFSLSLQSNKREIELNLEFNIDIALVSEVFYF